MKKAFATASLLAIMAAAPALAQTTAPSTPPANTPPGTTSPSTTSPSDKSAMPAAKPSDSTAAKPSDSAMASTSGWRLSKLMGHKIVNANKENVGDINDVILDNSGKATAVIVGVGGFLGMGEKNVALQFDQLSINRDANNNLAVMVNASKDSLQKAPEWTDPNKSTTAK